MRRIALFRRIPGRPAAFGDVVEAKRGGAALAILDDALRIVRLDRLLMVPGTFGPLDSVHKLVPDPRAAVAEAFGSSLSSPLLDIMARAEDDWARQIRAWPAQIIHSDFSTPAMCWSPTGK